MVSKRKENKLVCIQMKKDAYQEYPQSSSSDGDRVESSMKFLLLEGYFFTRVKSDGESLEVSQIKIYEAIRIYAECHLHCICSGNKNCKFIGVNF